MATLEAACLHQQRLPCGCRLRRAVAANKRSQRCLPQSGIISTQSPWHHAFDRNAYLELQNVICLQDFQIAFELLDLQLWEVHFVLSDMASCCTNAPCQVGAQDDLACTDSASTSIARKHSMLEGQLPQHYMAMFRVTPTPSCCLSAAHGQFDDTLLRACSTAEHLDPCCSRSHGSSKPLASLLMHAR